MKKDKQKSALILGVTGQDGAHLAQLLINEGYYVYGGYRRGGLAKTWRLDYLGIKDKIKMIDFQLNEPLQLATLFKNIEPDHIYHLAGESFIADSFNYPTHTITVNTLGTLNVLEAAKNVLPNVRIFFASSSEVFGDSHKTKKVNEDSVKTPSNPYAISRLAAESLVRTYRDKFGMFVCSGILFNHEGPLRSSNFVTRKITSNLALLKYSKNIFFKLGNLDSKRDWGSAADFVNAMYLMLKATDPSDYIISYGQLTSVRTLLETAALHAGFDPTFEGANESEICIDKKSGKTICKVSSEYYRPFEGKPIVGDSSKLKKELHWETNKQIKDIIKDMVDSDIDRINNNQIIE